MGDTFKLGQSSRLYVLCGPAELMPEEGLSKAQRQQLRALQVRGHAEPRTRHLSPGTFKRISSASLLSPLLCRAILFRAYNPLMDEIIPDLYH